MQATGWLALAEGQVPMPTVSDETGFFSLWKILVMVVFLFLWAWPAGWTCRDARRLVLNQSMWGTIVAGAGVLGWFCWIMLPWFIVGWLCCLLFSFGAVLAYAIYRDSTVEEEDKILRWTNLVKTIRGEGQQAFEVVQKVRLVNRAGIELPIPEDRDTQRIYQTFQDLLFDTLWRRASDVYVQPGGQGYRVLFRIDGVMNEYVRYDRQTAQATIDYVKGSASMDVDERRQPQTAKLVVQQVDVDRTVELDIETSGSTAGERLTLKIRAEEAKFTIDDLGFTEEQLDIVHQVMEARNGLVVFGGMNRSGLTTTLYGLSRSHDAFMQNIHSVEKKPLMALDNITQNIYQAGSEQSFARLLQSTSRREPDIILVDPCADPETMQMISQLVTTKKKKIYTTLRASGVLSALKRSVRWIEDQHVAGSILIALTFQRLARKLCPACREAYQPNMDTLRKLNLSGKSNVMFYRPPTQPPVDRKGRPIVCPTCQGTGYLGRTAIFEVLVLNDALREAILADDPTTIKAVARKSGYKYWQEVAMEKVIAGITSVQEIARVSKEAQAKTKS